MPPPSSTQPEKGKYQLEDTHSRTLSKTRLTLVFTAVCLVQFTSFLDQTAVTTAIPQIASSLGIGPSISWVFSAFLASSTGTQLIIGRLSDIFGRKACLITALFVMGIGNLLTGFAKNDILLYVWRAVSGLGAGCLNSQAMIVISDLTKPHQRGNAFGAVGVFIAVGNGLGPVVGGLLTETAGWQWAFWIIVPMCALTAFMLAISLPNSGQKEDWMGKLRLVDWAGVILTMGGTFLVLIPISEGGSTFPFVSAEFIAPLVIGIVAFIVFVVVEWRWARFPVMPLRIFQTGYAANAYLWQNIAYGWCFFGNLYFTPIYFQNVRGDSPARSGVLILPLVIAHGIFSAVSGSIISRVGKSLWAIILGTGLWTAGLACQARWYDRDTTVLAYAFIGCIQGIGVGFCFQPNLIGLLASSYRNDRAVASAMRLFIRAVGGAVGIAVSNAILNNVLRSGLAGTVPASTIGLLASSTAGLDKMGFSADEINLIKNTYMSAMHIIFIVQTPLMGLSFVGNLFIKDRGLAPLDDPSRMRQPSDDAGSQTEVDAPAGDVEKIGAQAAAATGIFEKEVTAGVADAADLSPASASSSSDDVQRQHALPEKLISETVKA